MPKVITQCMAAQVQAAHAGIRQADGQFRIFATPADKRLVVAVNADKVVAPDGEIATANAAQAVFDFANGKRPAEGIFQAGNLILKNGASAVGGKSFWPNHAAAFSPTSARWPCTKNPRFAASAMVGNEIRMRNRVAVEKNQIICARRGNRPVQDARPAEALMFLPDMLGTEWLRRPPFLKRNFRFVRRAVVGEQDFLRQ
jgi:hypothetical protein